MTSDASVVTAAKSKEIDRPRATGGREIIRQFTPNWFTATMGTGITALAINQLPLAVPGLHTVGTALWLFNIALFVLFSELYAGRWVFFFDEASRIFGHSVVSMFFGAIPMGLATILNGFIVFGPDLIGYDAAIAAPVATRRRPASKVFAPKAAFLLSADFVEKVGFWRSSQIGRSRLAFYILDPITLKCCRDSI